MVNHTVRAEFLTHIGDIVVSYALLETLTKFLAFVIIPGDQNIGQIITSELSFRSLRALILNLHLEIHGNNEQHEKLKGLMSRISVCEDRRNQIIHSSWLASSDDTISRFKTTAKEKGLKFHMEELKVDDLTSFAKQIKRLCGEVKDFFAGLLKG